VVAALSGPGVVLGPPGGGQLLKRISDQGKGSKLAAAVGRDVKGKLSAALYAAAIPLAFVREWIADAIYVLVALMWLVPDRRIESRLQD
jgi:uncharacterized membrane protein